MLKDYYINWSIDGTKVYTPKQQKKKVVYFYMSF